MSLCRFHHRRYSEMSQEDFDKIANKADPTKMWFDFLKHTRPEIVKASLAYMMFWWMTLCTIFGFSMLVLFQLFLRRKLEQVIKILLQNT